MGKKRKASRPSGGSGPKELDPADARLGPINTYEDLADSEEEYFMNKDKILLEDEPLSKRLKRQQEEDEFLEPSDEEVLDFDQESEEEEESDEESQGRGDKATKAPKKAVDASDDEQEADEEGDPSWWGDSKQEYYNADNIETEADALEEEAEARRLQQKKLSKMSEADFIFDEDEWLAPGKADAEGGEVVTEVLKDLEVTDDMGPEERLRILQARYPEFEYLVDEFQTLQPQLAVCQKEAEGRPSKSLEVVKHWILGSYVAALASYFAILTSPARDTDGIQKPIDPAELRDHEIMETLISCREAWQKIRNLKASRTTSGALPSPPEDEPDAFEHPDLVKKSTKKAKDAAVNGDKKKKKAEKEKRAKAKEIEDSLADLSTLLDTSKKAKKVKFATSAPAPAEDDRSDFGEEDIIDARTAADKAAKKKSLRFYTSQIVQKANRRSDAGRDAGGDMDIPYRERLRDRQARLNAEAERRGQKDSKHGTALGESSDDEDNTVANNMRDNEDEYYDMVAAASKRKRDDKAAKYEALAAASKADRVIEQEEIGEDGKRKITYAIQKNKGLTPRRKKDVRNPRVKKRKAYKAKQQKLGSMRAVYKGGEGRGGYQGEQTGIKSGLVKSVKL